MASPWAHSHPQYNDTYVTGRGNGYWLLSASCAFFLLRPGGQAMVHLAFPSVASHQLKPMCGRFPPSHLPRVPAFSAGWFLGLSYIPFPGGSLILGCRDLWRMQ